ncbi:MAG TPA: baseplate J/gp47 family protein [Lysobacter sp.]
MTFTAVDLSRLPAPAVVKPLDYEAVLAEMLAKLRTIDPQFTSVVESDPVYKILQVAAFYLVQKTNQVNDAARAVMLAYAQGSDLDQLGALFGVARLVLDPGSSALGIPATLESDVEFRRRIQLAPEGYSVAGPEGAYIYHALSADAGVLDASATSPNPGVVVVTVLGRDGDGAPSAALVNAVAARLSDDSIRPLTDQVRVQGATIVPYQVAATVYTYAGPDSTLVLAESTRRLRRYVDEAHRLGRDIPLSGIYSVLHSEGVQRVELTSPAQDIVISRTQAAYCTGITVTPGGVNE